MLLVHLYVYLKCFLFSISLSFGAGRLAAACELDTPWTFHLTVTLSQFTCKILNYLPDLCKIPTCIK